MTKAYICDVKNWLRTLQERGHNTFTAETLVKEDLMNKAYIHKASSLNFIVSEGLAVRRYGKFKKNHTNLWRINLKLN